MQIALAVGTLLLGSWVLNAPEEEEETETRVDAAAGGGSRARQAFHALYADGAPAEPDGSRAGSGNAGAGRTTYSCDAGQRDRAIASLVDDRRAHGFSHGAHRAMPPGGVFGQPTAPTASGPQGPVPIVGPGAFAGRASRWRPRRSFQGRRHRGPSRCRALWWR